MLCKYWRFILYPIPSTYHTTHNESQNEFNFELEFLWQMGGLWWDSFATSRATSHTRMRHVILPLQALSLMEKAELVQVRFALRLRDQWSTWGQGGCKACMTSNGSWSLGLFSKKPVLGGRPNTKAGDHATMNIHNRWFYLFYHVWGPARLEVHWNSIWLRAPSHMASHYTWGSVTTLHDFGGVLGRSLDTFFWALTMSWSRLLARVLNGRNSAHRKQNKASRPKTNNFLKPTLCTTCIHLEGASKCRHVIHSVGFRAVYHITRVATPSPYCLSRVYQLSRTTYIIGWWTPVLNHWVHNKYWVSRF